MKTEEDVRARLESLRSKYLRRHVRASQRREHRNCVHNAEHIPKPLPYKRQIPTDLERAPRRQVSLVVLNDDENSRSIRICMYGADTPSAWQGNTCDSDDVSADCPMFQPMLSSHEAALDFEQSLEDDATVLQKYPDVAALQWVVQDRLHARKPILYGLKRFFLLLWLSIVARLRPGKRRKAEAPIVPDDFWK